MDTIPEVPRCFGMFPPTVGAYFISLFGLASGGAGIAGIVLYGIAEDSFVAHFISKNPPDDEVKKVVLLTLGLTCLLLFIGSALLFIGMAFKQDRALLLAAWIIFAMCMILIIVSIGIPLSCFFLEELCVLKKMSTSMYTLFYIAITVFLWFWLYFMAVIFNYANARL